MATKYLDLSFTDSVCRAQKQYYGNVGKIVGAPERDSLSEAEAQFIADRDSFYLGSINESGWPYIQHRGGPKGFVKIVDKNTIAFADYSGNRQYITQGNLSENPKAHIFVMDYKNRERLKILGHARVEDAHAHPELIEQITDPKMRSAVERLVFIDVVSFDWNCPKYITPRYSAEEVEEHVEPLKHRIAELEAQLRKVKS